MYKSKIFFRIILIVLGLSLIYGFTQFKKSGNVETGYKVVIDTTYIKYLRLADMGPDSDMYYSDVCHYNLTLPQVHCENNPAFEEKFNQKVRDLFKFYDIDINDIKSSVWNGNISASFNVYYNNNSFVSLVINDYVYGLGAAHGVSDISSYNFSCRTGKFYNFNDLFYEKYKTEIHNKLVKAIEKYDCGAKWDEITFEDNPDRSYYFTKDSLFVIFHMYEVAAGVCGPITVGLNIDSLTSFAKPDGPVMFIKPGFRE